MLTRNRNILLSLCATLKPSPSYVTSLHPPPPPCGCINPRFIHPPVKNRSIWRLLPLLEAKGPCTLVPSLSLRQTEWNTNKSGQIEGVCLLWKKLHGQGWSATLLCSPSLSVKASPPGLSAVSETSNSMWSLGDSDPIAYFRHRILQVFQLPLAL